MSGCSRARRDVSSRKHRERLGKTDHLQRLITLILKILDQQAARKKAV